MGDDSKFANIHWQTISNSSPEKLSMFQPFLAQNTFGKHQVSLNEAAHFSREDKFEIPEIHWLS